LYTTVRELVENGLDAAEAVPVTPTIDVDVHCVGKDEFRAIVGMDADRQRVDSTLYKDVETEKERQKRETREKREAKKASAGCAQKQSSLPLLEDDAGFDDASQTQPPASQLPASQSQAPASTTTKARSSAAEIFRVTVRDNGTGMAHDDVPNMMGRVLTGTKYCVRQSRGKFGLGSKMALIWSKMSTGLPVCIRTAQSGANITSCILDIDMAKNTPTIISHTTEPNPDGWRGSEVSVTIQGSWTSYRAKLLLYMRQMAVITPYSQFRFNFRADPAREGRNFELMFARRTDVMPPAAQEVKHHPSSVDQYRLKRLISEVRPSMTVHKFLTSQFVSIPASLATRLLTELRFERSMPVKDLEPNHIRQLNELLQMARFDKPNGDCLSPAGEYNLRLGITKELRPAMVATHAEPADVFEGHAFVVEVGIALGGVGLKPGITVYRFANRIPLLFEAGNDVVTRTAKENIRWNNYKMSPVNDRIGVICSIVSTKVPFKGTGKEYIGDDAESIKVAVKRALTQCCIQLKSKLVRRAAIKDAADRKQSIIKYAPDVANALAKVFESVGDDADEEVADVVRSFAAKQITRDTLKEKLIEHVEQFDKEQALEYATTAGRDARSVRDVFFAERAAPAKYTSVGPVFTVKRGGEHATEGESGAASESVQMCLLSSLHGRI
jgi:DNA topoisomerase VI subunit B